MRSLFFHILLLQRLNLRARSDSYLVKSMKACVEFALNGTKIKLVVVYFYYFLNNFLDIILCRPFD